MQALVPILSFSLLAFLAAAPIVDGQSAKKYQFPWQVSLQDKNKGHFCSGAILSATHIVTAAHCFQKKGIEKLRIKGGRRGYLRSLDYLPRAKTIHIHPRFIVNEKRPGGADVAVLELERPIIFNRSIKPIKILEHSLLSDEKQAFSNKLLASGWGRTQTGEFSQALKYISDLTLYPAAASEYWQGTNFLDIISRRRNRNRLEIEKAFQTGDYLAVQGHRRQTICHGDSGGPLTYVKDDEVYLAGVAAHISHRDCARSRMFFYTDLSRFKTWLDEFL